MKKIISVVLLLTLCLGLFAGCEKTPAETTSNLANAKAIVFNTYKPASKDEVPAKSADFEVMTSVLVEGVSYPVEWSVQVTSGAADAVKIVDGSSAAWKKVDVTEKPETEIKFTLTAVVKDGEGNSETLTFNYMTPAFEAPTASKVVLFNVADALYATGTEYQYTSSSSGNVKMELTLSENKADALAYTLLTNDDGTVSFLTDCGKYLYCDANSVEFATEAGDYTKFILEAAEGGYYIKCAVANYNGNAQYLEIYSGYLTCYGLSASSNVNLYIFALEEATGANGTVVEYTPSETPDPEPEPEVEPQLPDVTAPADGTAYKFGLIQVTNGTTVYVTGEVSGRYLATTTDKDAAADVYVETVDGGCKFYILVDGAKNYIYIYNNDEGKRSVAYSATEANVFTFNAECGNWVTTFDGKECYLGSYNNFETISVSDTSYINKDNAGIKQFPAGFFAIAAEVPAPEVGVAYKMYVNHVTVGKTLYFLGTTANKDYYMATSENIAEAMDVYLESVDGGYRLYFLSGEVKTYIDIYQNGNYINLRLTDAPTAVYSWNAEAGTLIATLEDGTTTAYIGAYGTYETMSASATTYMGGEGSFSVEFVKA